MTGDVSGYASSVHDGEMDGTLQHLQEEKVNDLFPLEDPVPSESESNAYTESEDDLNPTQMDRLAKHRKLQVLLGDLQSSFSKEVYDIVSPKLMEEIEKVEAELEEPEYDSEYYEKHKENPSGFLSTLTKVVERVGGKPYNPLVNDRKAQQANRHTMISAELFRLKHMYDDSESSREAGSSAAASNVDVYGKPTIVDSYGNIKNRPEECTNGCFNVTLIEEVNKLQCVTCERFVKSCAICQNYFSDSLKGLRCRSCRRQNKQLSDASHA